MDFFAIDADDERLTKELLTGKLPFYEIQRDSAVMIQVGQAKRPNRPKQLSDELWELLEKCWAQLPADRPSAIDVESMVI